MIVGKRESNLKECDKKFGEQFRGDVSVETMLQEALYAAAPDERQVGNAGVALISAASEWSAPYPSPALSSESSSARNSLKSVKMHFAETSFYL